MSLLLSGKIQALLDRLTSARAANLDQITSTRMARLDATVSSRASATAVQTIDNNVDTILARVPSTVASSSAVSAIPTSMVRSVQSGGFFDQSPIGTASIYGGTRGYYDHTITAVTNIDKCLVDIRGFWNTDGTSHAVNADTNYPLWAHLQNTTTLRVFFAAGTTLGKMQGFYRITEFY